MFSGLEQTMGYCMLSRICLPSPSTWYHSYCLVFSFRCSILCTVVWLLVFFFFTHSFISLPSTCWFEYPSGILCSSSVFYVLFCLYCCLSCLSLSLRFHVWYFSPPPLLKYFGIIVYFICNFKPSCPFLSIISLILFCDKFPRHATRSRKKIIIIT